MMSRTAVLTVLVSCLGQSGTHPMLCSVWKRCFTFNGSPCTCFVVVACQFVVCSPLLFSRRSTHMSSLSPFFSFFPFIPPPVPSAVAQSTVCTEVDNVAQKVRCRKVTGVVLCKVAEERKKKRRRRGRKAHRQHQCWQHFNECDTDTLLVVHAAHTHAKRWRCSCNTPVSVPAMIMHAHAFYIAAPTSMCIAYVENH